MYLSYLEIYPIENYAEKISKQLDDVLVAKPNMYEKTRGRYKRLAYSLLQSVEKISAILEEESLVSCTSNEFDELSNEPSDVAEIVDTLESIKQGVDSFTSFVQCKNDTTKTTSSDNINNKEIFRQYAKVLSEGAIHRFATVEATECAQIIYMWFETRFMSTKSANFRYQISQIPIWISSIVLLYGHFINIGQPHMLRSIMQRWSVKVVSDSSFVWAVPYEVQNFVKDNLSAESFTLEAVLIYDMLIEELYHQLALPYFSDADVAISPSYVADVVKKARPELERDIRVRFAKQSELVSKCNLTYM